VGAHLAHQRQLTKGPGERARSPGGRGAARRLVCGRRTRASAGFRLHVHAARGSGESLCRRLSQGVGKRAQAPTRDHSQACFSHVIMRAFISLHILLAALAGLCALLWYGFEIGAGCLRAAPGPIGVSRKRTFREVWKSRSPSGQTPFSVQERSIVRVSCGCSICPVRWGSNTVGALHRDVAHTRDYQSLPVITNHYQSAPRLPVSCSVVNFSTSCFVFRGEILATVPRTPCRSPAS